MVSPNMLDELKKRRKACDEMYKRLEETANDDHEHEWMANGHCAWCGEADSHGQCIYKHGLRSIKIGGEFDGAG